MSEAILAIDPGDKRSAFVVLKNGEPYDFGIEVNSDLLEWLSAHDFDNCKVAIEMIASYGMPVGKEVFETCVWIGRFIERIGRDDIALVYRKDVKMFLCNSTKAKDGNVRQAIIDLYPATGGGKVPQIGVKKQPGPLYGISEDVWAALAVALTFQNMLVLK